MTSLSRDRFMLTPSHSSPFIFTINGTSPSPKAVGFDASFFLSFGQEGIEAISKTVHHATDEENLYLCPRQTFSSISETSRGGRVTLDQGEKEIPSV